MSEMAQASRLWRGNLGLHVIKNPAGTWSFAGSVPAELCWTFSDPELVNIARSHGESLARARAKHTGQVFQTRVWPTEAEARQAALELGYQVT